MKKIRYIVRILIIDNLKIKTINVGRSLNGTITNLFLISDFDSKVIKTAVTKLIKISYLLT